MSQEDIASHVLLVMVNTRPIQGDGIATMLETFPVGRGKEGSALLEMCLFSKPRYDLKLICFCISRRSQRSPTMTSRVVFLLGH
jgi:hypothetical protein